MATTAVGSPTMQLDLLGVIDGTETPGVIAGVDEVGRGALFGPVVAAAVILPNAAIATLVLAGVRDSKQLSPPERLALAQQIRQVAVDYQIGYASVREIDQLNILQASLLAMKRAILKLKVPPDRCLIDGNQRIPELPFAQQTLVKGDARSPAIAAASIIAKVWRDELITRLDKRYPLYHLASNKGYGTPSHRQAIQAYGPTRYHRTSFSPCRVGTDRRNDTVAAAQLPAILAADISE